MNHRTSLSTLLLLLLLAPELAFGAWPRNGLPVAPGSDSQSQPVIVADGLGAFMVGWVSALPFGGRVRIQRRSTEGGLAFGWPDSGITVLSMSANLSMVGDGEGGVYVAGDPASTFSPVMITHVSSAGSAYQRWPLAMPVTQVPLLDEPDEEAVRDPGWSPHIGTYYTLMPVTATAPDGAMMVAWMHSTYSTDHVHVATFKGNSEPPPGWQRYGARVGDHGPAFPSACPDDSGGAYVAVVNLSTSPRTVDVYHRSHDGSSVSVTTLPTGTHEAHAVSLVPDGRGGVLVAWQAWATAGEETTWVQRVHHRIGVDPAWPAPGVRLSTFPSQAGTQRTIFDVEVLAHSIAADGAGGAYVTWTERSAERGTDVFVQRVTGEGTIASGWPEGGVAVCQALGNQEHPRVVADADGAYVVWEDRRAGNADVYLQYVSAGGTRNWPGEGYPVCDAAGAQQAPALSPDGNGAMIAWMDGRAAPPQVYATRVALGDRVAVTASLVRLEADEHSVQIEWRLGGDPPAAVTLERSAGFAAWRLLATLAPEADGAVRHVDADVSAGASYRYRLRAGNVTLSEVAIQIPDRPSFALDPPTPNPAVSGWTLGFELPTTSAARLEVVDATGRRVLRHALPAPRAGRHRVRMPGLEGLPPGLYLVTLVQDGRAVTRRASIMR